MAVSFLRTVLLYVVVIFAIRMMGKRQIGELQPSELVITILISNIATLPLEDPDIPLLAGVVPMISLICFEVLISFLSLKSRKLRRLISGTPKLIIRNGEIDQKVLKDLRFSVDDLMASLRGAGVFNLKDVQLAVVETTGNVSVYQTFAARTVSHEDLQQQGTDCDPPSLLITDGEILEVGLQRIGRDKAWLQSQLKSRGLTAGDVLLFAGDAAGNFQIVPKDPGSKGGTSPS